ncbi:MAG: H-NS histone family protein [Magnetococcales bacterium]|nr:H-NS histone family protein [Magnetococcales bacterium]
MAKEKKTEMDHQTIQSTMLSLPLEALVLLKSDVDALIKQRQRERKKDLYNKMLAMVQDAGFDSVEAFVSSQGRSPRSDKGVRLPPRYQNPHNAKQTWSGKGRKPGWVVEHLANGGQIEALAIA